LALWREFSAETNASPFRSNLSFGGNVLYLHGIGHFHPDTVIDNSFLTSLDIGVDTAWVEERVGILERRTTLSLDYIRQTKNADARAAAEAATTTTLEMGKRAAELAIRRAGIEPSAIQLVVGGGSSPEQQIPAEGCRVAGALGINAPSFDLKSACTSFAAQVHFVNQMLPESLPDYILVVDVETVTRSTDYSDRRTAVLFGDAAAAAVLSPRIPAAARISQTCFHSDPSGHQLITIRLGGHVAQEGNNVQMFAIRKTTDLFEQTRLNGHGPSGMPEYFVGHQANLRMLESVCRRLNIPEKSHLYNVVRFGNCGAASAPSVLSQHWDFLESCAINMAIVGSGLSWGAMRICKSGRASI
jgi:3-oxoacyl-[acyl-carrier-protein] synthase-3